VTRFDEIPERLKKMALTVKGNRMRLEQDLPLPAKAEAPESLCVERQ
jgi:hypothetical protein